MKLGSGSPARRIWHVMEVGSQLHSLVALPTGQVLTAHFALVHSAVLDKGITIAAPVKT
jgi:hypothetical protein